MDYAQAVARVLSNRITEAKTTSARGTVTAISSDGFVTFTDAASGTRKGVWVGEAPRVGEVITYLDEGRGIPLVFGATGRPQVPRYPLFYTAGVSNGTATTPTTVIAQPSIMVAPAPMWMIVECVVEQGANSAPNSPIFAIDTATAGANNGYSGGAFIGGEHQVRNWNADSRSSFLMTSRTLYAQGDTVGFNTRYWVDGYNIYLTHAAIVRFYPPD